MSECLTGAAVSHEHQLEGGHPVRGCLARESLQQAGRAVTKFVEARRACQAAAAPHTAHRGLASGGGASLTMLPPLPLLRPLGGAIKVVMKLACPRLAVCGPVELRVGGSGCVMGRRLAGEPSLRARRVSIRRPGNRGGSSAGLF